MGVLPSVKAITFYGDKLLCYLRDDDPQISDPNKWDIPGADLRSEEDSGEGIRRIFREQFNVSPLNVKHWKVVQNAQGIPVNVYLIYLSQSEVENLSLGNRGQKFELIPLRSILSVDLTPPVKKFLTLFFSDIHKLSRKS